MKITESQLRSIVRQELKKVLNENYALEGIEENDAGMQAKQLGEKIVNLIRNNKPYKNEIEHLNGMLQNKTITFELSEQGEYGRAKFHSLINKIDKYQIGGPFVYIKLQEPLQYIGRYGTEDIQQPEDRLLKTTTDSIIAVN